MRTKGVILQVRKLIKVQMSLTCLSRLSYMIFIPWSTLMSPSRFSVHLELKTGTPFTCTLYMCICLFYLRNMTTFSLLVQNVRHNVTKDLSSLRHTLPFGPPWRVYFTENLTGNFLLHFHVVHTLFKSTVLTVLCIKTYNRFYNLLTLVVSDPDLVYLGVRSSW